MPFKDILPHNHRNNAESLLVEAQANLGHGRWIEVKTPKHNPLKDYIIITNLHEVRTPYNHDPTDFWCSCRMCCCKNGICTHYE